MPEPASGLNTVIRFLGGYNLVSILDGERAAAMPLTAGPVGRPAPLFGGA